MDRAGGEHRARRADERGGPDAEPGAVPDDGRVVGHDGQSDVGQKRVREEQRGRSRGQVHGPMFRAPLSSRHQAATVCAPHEGVAGEADLEYDAPSPGMRRLMKKAIGDNMIPKEWGFEKGLELVKQAGFDGIELWLGDVPWFQMGTRDSEGRELRRKGENAGRVVSTGPTGFRW